MKPPYSDFQRVRVSRFGATVFVALVFFGVGCSSEQPAETAKPAPVQESSVVEAPVEESPRIGEIVETLEDDPPQLGSEAPIRIRFFTSVAQCRVENVGDLHFYFVEPPGAREIDVIGVHGVHYGCLTPGPVLHVPWICGFGF